MRIIGRPALVASCAMLSVALAHPAWAQVKQFDVPAQPLQSAVSELGRQADIQIVAARRITRGKQAHAVRGAMSIEQALAMLLRGSGLVARKTGAQTYSVVVDSGEAQAGGAPADDERAGSLADASDDPITVTGTRIRGARVTSPVIVQTQQKAREEGQNTLTDIIRNIPQNFGGGTNPGISVGNVPESRGAGYGGGATLNLRGLGSDATLTLLNGHRLTYGVVNQGIDISAIPLLALDRIEVVADGSSALYGSDAVGGVANVILKRDYEGIATNARFSASTDGGNEQQQYGVIAGTRWRGGGFITAYEFERDTPIEARQRDYAAVRAKGLDLYPAQKRHSVVVAGHQELAPGVTFQFDALYNHRDTRSRVPYDAAGDYEVYGQNYRYDTETFSVSPSLNVMFGNGWAGSVVGSYGRESLHYAVDLVQNYVPTPVARACYCNTSQSVELNADGPLFPLPGGMARLAVGGGFRSNGFHGYRTLGTPQDIDVDQDVYFGFGELSLPLISPANDVALVESLNVSAAVRYERYDEYDIATPKFGLIYAPTPDVELRGSWGKSFKAPTLYQQFNLVNASVDAPSYYSAAGYPDGSMVLYLGGGSRTLRPERATNWTTTLVLHPRAVPGLEIEASYFNVRYRDRVTYPLTYARQALTNPEYAGYVNYAPTMQQAADAAASAALFNNYTDLPFDPARVVAIIDNRNTNVARQNIQGVDLGLRYTHDLGDDGTLNLTANASYIEIKQRLNALAPETELTGTVFSPPHFRLRAGASWRDDGLSVTSYVNYQDGVDDARATEVLPGRSYTTIDFALRYEIADGPRIFRGLEMILSVTNLFNARPPSLATTQFYQAPYDTTNYSPFGRVVGLSLIKKW